VEQEGSNRLQEYPEVRETSGKKKITPPPKGPPNVNTTKGRTPAMRNEKEKKVPGKGKKISIVSERDPQIDTSSEEKNSHVMGPEKTGKKELREKSALPFSGRRSQGEFTGPV